MKTAEEFIAEIAKNDALKNKLKEIADKAGLSDFLKANGVGATAEDFAKAARKQAEAEAELGDADAETVAGGIPLF